MSCCEYKCEQGRDCPIRKQRAQEVNEAYINRGSWGKVDDPYSDVSETFKALIAVIAVTGAVTLLAFVIWGK